MKDTSSSFRLSQFRTGVRRKEHAILIVLISVAATVVAVRGALALRRLWLTLPRSNADFGQM